MSNEDPFGSSEKRPSVSFKDAPIGTQFTLRVESAPKVVQARDYDTGDPAFWPDGNPKMTVVTDVINVHTGEQLGLWAPKPSALFAAIGAAQTEAGQTVAAGGTLIVTYTGDKVNPEKPRLNPAKQYRVTYTPPGPGTPGDAFAAPVEQPVAAAAPTPTPEAIEALKAAGVDPSVVYGAAVTAAPPS